MNDIKCECSTWATTNMAEQFLGNGHNPSCKKFIAGVGGMELLRELVAGIRRWSADEDGVHPNIWAAFKRAVFITEGKMLTDEEP